MEKGSFHGTPTAQTDELVKFSSAEPVAPYFRLFRLPASAVKSATLRNFDQSERRSDGPLVGYPDANTVSWKKLAPFSKKTTPLYATDSKPCASSFLF